MKLLRWWQTPELLRLKMLMYCQANKSGRRRLWFSTVTSKNDCFESPWIKPVHATVGVINPVLLRMSPNPNHAAIMPTEAHTTATANACISKTIPCRDLPRQISNGISRWSKIWRPRPPSMQNELDTNRPALYDANSFTASKRAATSNLANIIANAKMSTGKYADFQSSPGRNWLRSWFIEFLGVSKSCYSIFSVSEMCIALAKVAVTLINK